MSTSSATYVPEYPVYLPDIYRLDKEGTLRDLTYGIAQYLLTCPKENCASLELSLRANNCRTYLFPTNIAFPNSVTLRGRVCKFELFISREDRHAKKVQQASEEKRAERLMQLEDTGYATFKSAEEFDKAETIVKSMGGTFTCLPESENFFVTKEEIHD